MKKLMIMISLIMLSCMGLRAQNFAIRIAPTFPIADFGGDDYDNVFNMIGEDGCANVGVNLGFQYQYPIVTDGLHVIGSMDFFYNSVKKFVFPDEYSFVYQTAGRPNYINIPLMAGLNYQYDFSGAPIGIYAEAEIGANARFVTPFRLTEDIFNSEIKIKYTPAITFCGKAEIGVVINDWLTVGVAGYMLGNRELRAKRYFNNEFLYKSTSREKLGTNMILLTVGFNIL